MAMLVLGRVTFSPLKMDGWNTIFSEIGALGLFSGAMLAVSFREGNIP